MLRNRINFSIYCILIFLSVSCKHNKKSKVISKEVKRIEIIFIDSLSNDTIKNFNIAIIDVSTELPLNYIFNDYKVNPEKNGIVYYETFKEKIQIHFFKKRYFYKQISINISNNSKYFIKVKPNSGSTKST